jgi:hypothetical protein
MPGPSLKTLALAALMLGAAPAFAQTVPALNVERTCHDIPAETAVNRDPSICLKSENDAHDQLAKEWSSFPVADRGLCTQTATMGGTASYVELLTCLEMRRDARALPKDALTRLNQ